MDYSLFNYFTGKSKAVAASKSTSSASNYSAIVLIGDTSSVFVYAVRLLQNGVNVPIHIIIEGQNTIASNPEISDTNFVVAYRTQLLNYFRVDKVRYANPGQQLYMNNTGYSYASFLELFYTGYGPLGSNLYQRIVDVGPWYPRELQRNANGQLIKRSAIIEPYNTLEMQVATYVANQFGLSFAPKANIAVENPSVAQSHIYFLKNRNTGGLARNFFRKYYQIALNTNSNSNSNFNTYCTVHTQCTNITFSANVTYPTNYDVAFLQGGNPVLISNSTVALKTFDKDYQRILLSGGLNPKPSKSPCQYVAVVPMSKSLSGLTNYAPDAEGTTSRISFSTQDLSNNKSASEIVWQVSVYTNDMFLGIENITADPSTGNTLLCVEAVCLANCRRTTYETNNQQIAVSLNQVQQEQLYAEQFAVIVAAIYQGYTGQPLSTPTDFSVCSNGVCMYNNDGYTDRPAYNTVPASINQFVTSLYQNFLVNGQGAQQPLTG